MVEYEISKKVRIKSSVTGERIVGALKQYAEEVGLKYQQKKLSKNYYRIGLSGNFSTAVKISSFDDEAVKMNTIYKTIGIGTTNDWSIANKGDSRIYLFGEVEKIGEIHVHLHEIRVGLEKLL